MLDLKLKAWCYDSGEFVDIKHLAFIGEDLYYLQSEDEDGNDIDPPYFSDRLGIDWELLQYTGMKDENDDDIYPGDFVKVVMKEETTPIRSCDGAIMGYDFLEGYSQIGIISYVKGEYYYDTVRTLKGEHHNISIPLHYITNCRIVGNKYENPELLEGE